MVYVERASRGSLGVRREVRAAVQLPGAAQKINKKNMALCQTEKQRRGPDLLLIFRHTFPHPSGPVQQRLLDL